MFKYSPLRSIFFENYLIRATQRSALNDPFEILPSRDWLEAAYFCYYNREYNGNFENLLSLFTKLNLNSFGVISLASRNDNILMWSHYGDEHRGMVIELDGENALLKQRFGAHSDRDLAQNVIYRRNRIDNFDKSMKFLPYIEKSLEWAYEEEKRIIVTNLHSCDRWMYIFDSEADSELALSAKSFEGIYLKSCERNGKVISFNLDFDFPVDKNRFINCPKFMSMFRIPPEAIKSVTFGVNADILSIQNICKIIKSNEELKHLKIYEARLSDDKYGIVVVEKNA